VHGTSCPHCFTNLDRVVMMKMLGIIDDWID
jgi:hypothetical protein